MIGVKKDDNKMRPSLVLDDMPRALLAVAEVATFGAEKYSDGNWLHVDGALSRYTDAKDRHRLQSGIEARDSESGLLHAAHEAWNALAVLELMIRSSERAAQPLWPESAEQRIDIIAASAGDGEHYAELDMSDPKNWREGDLVEALISSFRSQFTKGVTYSVLSVNHGSDCKSPEHMRVRVKEDDEGQENRGGVQCFKWHSRPTSA